MTHTGRLSAVRLSPKQVALLAGRASAVNLYGDRLLEWLEFECDIAVTRLEAIPAARLDYVLEKLERNFGTT